MDITETVELFSKIKDNSVVVSLLAAVVGVYIILVIWARAKDRQDLVKVRGCCHFNTLSIIYY